MHHCILSVCFSNGSCTPPHKSIGMQSIVLEALESQVLWDTTTEGLWTCKHLSHISTKPFLLSERGGKAELRKEMSNPKKGDEICNVTARLSGDSFFLIKGSHHNVHKLLPVHLQWSVQSCKTAGILKALALTLLRFSVDHL